MIAQEFSQYRRLMSGLAAPVLRSLASPGSAALVTSDSVLRGIPAAMLLIEDNTELHAALAAGFRQLTADGRAAQAGRPPMLRDPAGHGRDVYYPLVLHLHLAAFAKLYETLPVSLWGVCEDALPDACLGVRVIEAFTDTPPPAALAARVLWEALCLLEQAKLASRDVDIELVESVVHQIAARPGPGGTLHPRDTVSVEESLDAWTYSELAGLHALTHLALQRRNKMWAARVQEIAVFHLENTQPDNTTNEPWAAAGFLWSPRAQSFAEQQIHDATAQGVAPVAAMLLADAAAALAVFETK